MEREDGGDLQGAGGAGQEYEVEADTEAEVDGEAGYGTRPINSVRIQRDGMQVGPDRVYHLFGCTGGGTRPNRCHSVVDRQDFTISSVAQATARAQRDAIRW